MYQLIIKNKQTVIIEKLISIKYSWLQDMSVLNFIDAQRELDSMIYLKEKMFRLITNKITKYK